MLAADDLNSVCRTIHPDDQMWKGGESWYFPVGLAGLRLVQNAVSLSGLREVRTILDLPCGHGRVARYLRAGYPEAQLYFCDIDESGVDFCAQTFAGIGIVSKRNLNDVDLPKPLDIIWVGSLFTHLDEAHARTWLAYLCEHLSADGVLVATFAGDFVARLHKENPAFDAKAIADFEALGWGYAPYGVANDCGQALSKPGKVIEIASSIAGVRILHFAERGWADRQDVLVLTKCDRLRPWA